MSTTPFNANLGASQAEDQGLPEGRRAPRAPVYSPGREALQALLAFSSLHEQLRHRRSHVNNGSAQAFDAWAPEDFVLDDVLQLVSERALAVTGCDGVAIALTEGDEILCRAAAGELGPGPGTRLDPNSGFSGACFRTGLVIRCDDAERDPRVDSVVCRRMGLRSIVAVPLLTESGVFGLLEAFCSEAYAFNDSDVRSLTLLAELILAALKPQEDFPAGRDFASSQTVLGEVLQPELVPVAPPSPPTHLEAGEELPNVDSLRDALVPVTEHNSQVRPAEEAGGTGLFSQYTSEASPDSHSSQRWLMILLIVLVLLALAGAGVFWWWRIEHAKQGNSVAVKTDTSTPKQADSIRPTAIQEGPASSAQISLPPGEGLRPSTGSESALLEVSGIRHWSSSDSSTVVIDLQGQVQYEAHRLTDPERIYFDLHDTALSQSIPKDIEVGDALLVRIRVAQPTDGMTRVVLETKDSPNFSVSLETHPYRLMVEVRSISARPKSSRKINLFAPMKPAPLEHYAANRKDRTPGEWLEPPTTATSAENIAGVHPKFRIVLDAGHGGWDMGTVGRSGLLEKDLVLDIVARLGKLVSNHLGAEVIYTRRDDTYISLERRTELANLAQADMFLSVHANYSDLPSARGVETYYTRTYSSVHARAQGNDDPQAVNVDWSNVDIREKAQESRHLASDVQQALYRTLAAKNPLVRDRGVKEASYAVLTGTTMPAILAEVSFVSSPTDESKLESAAYREQIAYALFKGISSYTEKFHRVMASAQSSGQ